MTQAIEPKQAVLKSVGLFAADSRGARKTRDKLAADGIEKFQRAQQDRWKQERQWYLNLAFYYGQHYVRFRTDEFNRRFDMYVPSAPYYRVRPTINHIRRIVRKDVSRLTAQEPNAYVVPSSTEDRDVFAAQAGEQIWSSIWRQHNFNRVLRQAAFWQITCGNAFIKQFWDPYKRDDLNQTDGDIVIRTETPFHVFVPDLREENLEEQPCIVHAQVRHRDWIKNTFGMDVSSHKYDVVDESLLSIMGVNHQDRKDTTIILEVWVKPGYTPELPQGGMYTIVADKIVQGWEGWPYSHGQYPFSKLDGIPTGKFYNDSVVQDLIPLQRELNRTRGQVIEAKNRMAKPQLLAEEGSVDPSKITTEPGQVIQYKPGLTPPQALAMQNLPNYVTEEINRIYTDMADIAGQHDVSQGQVPSGVTAAVAISYLQEQDETILSPFYDSMEEGIENTARQSLSYVKDFWNEERTIKLAGVDSTFDVQTFHGSDLRGNTDIRVEAGSALPTSRAARQAFITDMMKMGFVDPQEGLEVLEIGGLNKIYERVQVDVRQAQRENLKMRVATEEDVAAIAQEWAQRPPEETTDPETKMKLNPPLVVQTNTYDNHQVHIEYHNRYRKSQAFEMASPTTKQMFEEHVKQHMEAMIGAAGVGVQLPPEMSNPLQQQGNPEEVPPPEGEEAQPQQPVEGMMQ